MMIKDLFCFWMVEHDYCLRRKDLYANRFKSEKLQEIRVSFDQDERWWQVSVHWAMES